VQLTDINKTFGGRGADAVHALKDINLSIKSNEFISLIGPSGCGKSTLLRLVGDLITPSAGDVRVNGKPAHEARLKREYGMVSSANTAWSFSRRR